jgi:hypothetical protein
VLFVDAKTVKHWFGQFFGFDPKINYACTNFALEMSVDRSVCIVPDFVTLYVEGQGNTILDEQI